MAMRDRPAADAPRGPGASRGGGAPEDSDPFQRLGFSPEREALVRARMRELGLSQDAVGARPGEARRPPRVAAAFWGTLLVAGLALFFFAEHLELPGPSLPPPDAAQAPALGPGAGSPEARESAPPPGHAESAAPAEPLPGPASPAVPAVRDLAAPVSPWAEPPRAAPRAQPPVVGVAPVPGPAGVAPARPGAGPLEGGGPPGPAVGVARPATEHGPPAPAVGVAGSAAEPSPPAPAAGVARPTAEPSPPTPAVEVARPTAEPTPPAPAVEAAKPAAATARPAYPPYRQPYGWAPQPYYYPYGAQQHGR
jgi:hypothetical protein